MDPVTHTLVGVGLANAFFREKIGPRAVPILAIASNWPDLDGVVMLSGDPAGILLRRTFGHSLLLMPFLAAALAGILKRFFPSQSWRALLGLSALGMAFHLLFDLVNSFGVALLWPASDWRPELGTIFIIDLILTGSLALPLLFRGRLETASRVSIAFVAAYLCFCGLNRRWALAALPRPDPAAFAYVFPEPLGPHRWRGVVREEGRWRVYLVHSLTGRVEPRGEIATALGDPAVERVRETRLAKRFEWFAKAPAWSASGSDVDVVDLRFGSIVIRREPSFRLRFKVLPDGSVARR